MRARVVAMAAAVVVVLGTGPTHAAMQYPLTLKLDAEVKSGATTITSVVTVQVNAAMDDVRRARVTDALKFGGYANFLNALRGVPDVGSVATQSTQVPIRYTREEQTGTGTRLVLIGDKPLFFLSRDVDKAKAGFELTVVELRFDAAGAITGQMAGAARVRPAPDGGVLLDTYAAELVQLKGQVARP